MPASLPLSPLNDRRSHERRILRVQAQLCIAGRAPLAVRTMDISEGGLGVLCPLNLRVHTHCTVQFSLPIPPTGRRAMELPVVVRYSILSSGGGGFELGMSVSALSAADQAAISLYIKG